MSQMTPPEPAARQPIPEGLSEREAQEVAASVDVSSRVRNYVGPFGIFLTLVAAAMSGFHLYTTLFGFFDAPIQRAIFYSFVMVLGFAIYPSGIDPGSQAFAFRPSMIWS